MGSTSRVLLMMLGASMVAGCQTEIPKEDLEAMGAWSAAVCDCTKKKSSRDAKVCAASLKKPAPLDVTTSGGKPKYKPEGAQMYSGFKVTGETCEHEIFHPE